MHGSSPTSPTGPGMTGVMRWTSARSMRNSAGSPRHDLATGLRETVEWYINHAEWVKAISQQSGYNDWLEKNYGKRGGSA